SAPPNKMPRSKDRAIFVFVQQKASLYSSFPTRWLYLSFLTKLRDTYQINVSFKYFSARKCLH
ncbi:hypothetical protein, partial [Herbaspirillum sp. UBA812]|uniref:hypothetical protein n=1 Tax=Herbaspirillum sp. UBA812 TaxID=1946590 RepID=UPI00257D6C10